MFTFMSLVTSVKDYVEITHKLIEVEPLKNYTEFGAVLTYFILSIGEIFKNIFNFSVSNIWSIPIIIPDIASSMISEVSVLDGYFNNAFTFLETSVNTATNPSLVMLQKFIIGLINSLFLFLPTSTSHLITLRRFVMQGLEAGYFAGLGTLAGNFFWLASIILGWRFFVIPWLSLDIFRYLLGFMLLVKVIADASKERRMALEDLSKWKIFLLNFLLALTEQSCIYPFISNLSVGPTASILEGFPVENYPQFLAIHGAYLLGILVGSFSLLQFTCWFWENPAFSIYLWLTTKSSIKFGSSQYYKVLNFIFLYGTMICAMASIPYYGLDYTITNPIGLVPQDRILDQKQSQSDPNKLITESAFLGVKPTDKNLRIRDGLHTRRDRWRYRLLKYQAFDASVYDQGVYDFLTIEDLNYGFDRFWLRRKMRNHKIVFRLFPGPWMRSLKKQITTTTDEQALQKSKSIRGPRLDFFSILFEQFYHPNFHDRNKIQSNTTLLKNERQLLPRQLGTLTNYTSNTSGITGVVKTAVVKTAVVKTAVVKTAVPDTSLLTQPTTALLTKEIQPGLLTTGQGSNTNGINNVRKWQSYGSTSALRKFVRNFNTRMNVKLLNKNIAPNKSLSLIGESNTQRYQFIYSKRWKAIFSKIQPFSRTTGFKDSQSFRNVAKRLLVSPQATSLKLTTISQKLSSKERKLLELRTFYKNAQSESQGIKSVSSENGLPWSVEQAFARLKPGETEKAGTSLFKKSLRVVPQTNINSLSLARTKAMLLHPVNVYLQKEQAFKRKLRYYGTTAMRKLTVGNQAPYLKTLMKRGFYYYKPSLRWKKTLHVAAMRRAGLRKKSRKKRILVMPSYALAQSPSLGTGDTAQTALSFLKSNPDTLSGSTNQNTLEITKPTHTYTVYGKRASRYRNQIYKDVLQHWYYTPFNRLLLKFDVDAFINRQPKSHFLTKNEERSLHIRRFLLSEHYDTLRWYTYMQHYKTMKTNIGGTKSFASRTYNQQFQGTFKKIRHLFAITPKQGDLYTLKFDQPLYNDNKLKENVYYHEELLTDKFVNGTTDIGRTNIQVNNPSINNTSIKTEESVNLNSFLTSYSDLPSVQSNSINVVGLLQQSENLDIINQSSSLIYTKFMSRGKSNDQSKIPNNFLIDQNGSNANLNIIYSEFFVKLIKECKKRVHDQTFLKNYITHRMEKREQLNQEQTKELNKRLEKLKTWLKNGILQPKTQINNLQLLDGGRGQSNGAQATNLSTGLQNAITDSLAWTNTNLSLPTYPRTNQQLSNAITVKLENDILNKLNLISSLTVQDPFTPGSKASVTGPYELGQVENTDKNQLKERQLLQKTKGSALVYLEKTKRLVQATISACKPILLDQTQLLKARTDKNLQWWRKKQRVITKRKTARKRDRFKKQITVVNKKLEALNKTIDMEKQNAYQILYGGTYDISDYLLNNKQNIIIDSTGLRKKQEEKTNSTTRIFDQTNNITKTGAWNVSYYKAFFNKKLSKKASSKGRRYRSLSFARYLTATRKPRLVGFEDLTKIDNITKLNGSILTKEEKQERLNSLIQNTTKGFDSTDSIKKSQIKKRSQHSWRKRVRHQFNRNHYRYRKRQIHGNGKLRVMNKKLKKLRSNYELRQWWWTSFLPRQVQLLPGSTGDLQTSNTQSWTKSLMLNSLPQTSGTAVITKATGVITAVPTGIVNNTILNSTSETTPCNNCQSNLTPKRLDDGFNSMSVQNNSNVTMPQTISTDTNLGSPTTSLPFYAGWDDSLRKFVVTNRLLSRRDTGLAVSETIVNPQKMPSQAQKESALLEFTTAPIQGLNEGSFLYWQTDMPFNSYNIDQFITTNQSFYAPLGWRHFEFRHSILKTWTTQRPSVITSETNNLSNNLNSKTHKTLIVSMKQLNQKSNKVQQTALKQETITTKKAMARRIKKRYKLLKQTPNYLMYAPTGALLTQVLPAHYISVFDQQYRLPRNRYLKRKTLKTLKKTTLLAMVDATDKTINGINKEFTLRKRIKSRRKYHKKRFINKEGLIFPRRSKFATTNNEDTILRWRPSSKAKQKLSLRKKSKLNTRVKANPLRLRQLRRREFQQLLKPTQRYIPQNGGFAWPGDYLRLEVVEMPKLISTNDRKVPSLKQKINVQPVGIMPRNYLIEKHNIKVLKKKLQKAYQLNQLNKVVKEYKNMIPSP